MIAVISGAALATFPARITSVSPNGSTTGVLEFPGGVVVPTPANATGEEVAFIEIPRFPDCYSFGAQIGPAFNTTVVELNSGYESRNQNWACERLMFDLTFIARTQAQRDELSAFFRYVRGRAVGFRCKDHSDFQVTDDGVLVERDGVFYMVKRYLLGALWYDRDIRKPRPGTVTVFPINGTPMNNAYTVNYEDGTVAIENGANGAFAWSGEFDVPVRFDTDKLQWSIIDRRGDSNAGLMYTSEDLKLIEIRL